MFAYKNQKFIFTALLFLVAVCALFISGNAINPQVSAQGSDCQPGFERPPGAGDNSGCVPIGNSTIYTSTNYFTCDGDLAIQQNPLGVTCEAGQLIGPLDEGSATHVVTVLCTGGTPDAFGNEPRAVFGGFGGTKTVTCNRGATATNIATASPLSEEAQEPIDPTGGGNLQGDCKASIEKGDCAIVAYLVTFINVLSALVGIVIAIMIAVGGIQYSASRDNPQAVAAAKGRITNAVLALVIFMFMFAFLQYLVPGGALNG